MIYYQCFTKKKKKLTWAILFITFIILVVCHFFWFLYIFSQSICDKLEWNGVCYDMVGVKDNIFLSGFLMVTFISDW